MSEGGTSFVVSDKLSKSIHKADLYNQLNEDVRLSTWEWFIGHSVDFDVLVLDMQLSDYTTDDFRNGSARITENTSAFYRFFKDFVSDISYLLESGDSVVVLLDDPIPVAEGGQLRQGEIIHSDYWLESLSVLNDWGTKSDSSQTVISELEPVREFFHAVSSHYRLNIDNSTVEEPDILAKSSDRGYPSGIAVNQFINDTGNWVESEGTLILLPQPKSLTKSHKIVEQLVDIGWGYHDDDRPKFGTSETESDSIQLSTSIERFDDELVEHCLSKYSRGEYADAASKALKILENRVKEAANDEIEYSSTANLMQAAFSPPDGPLQMGEQAGEQKGVMFLYSGAIQALRNPLAHRVVDPEKDRFLDDLDQQDAHDIIAFVNLLLSLLSNPFSDEEE